MMKKNLVTEFLKTDGIQFATDLTTLQVAAMLTSNALYFASSSKDIQQITFLNSGDDYNGWNSVYDIGNNWIFVGGAQYNHAIHLLKDSAGKWIADKTIRIVSADSVGEEVAKYILGMKAEQMARDHLADVITVKKRVLYSSSIKQLILPDDQKVFRNGQFGSIGNGNLETYIGESRLLKAIFFKAPDGQLFSYDGKNVLPLKNGKVFQFKMDGRIEYGFVRELTEMSRIFYMIRSGAYEIVRSNDGFELKKIDVPPTDSEGMLFTRFASMPDKKDIAVFTHEYVYALNNLKPIYHDVTKSIDTTGNDVIPAYIPPLGGVVFTTNGLIKHHLITECKP